MSQPDRLRISGIQLGMPGRKADVDLAYRVYGRLNGTRSNCILLPTYYTGSADSYLPWIGSGRPFDTDQFYVVVPSLIGNGHSQAWHAGTTTAWSPLADPAIRIHDNVTVQRVLLDHLGVRSVRLVAGWSMGGLQAYEWAIDYPDLVDAILPICASARCWPLNAQFLGGIEHYLRHAVQQPLVSHSCLCAFGHAYASWAYSATYYREELWRCDGFSSVQALQAWWAQDHQDWEPSQLLTMLHTWVSANPVRPGETFDETLGTIGARSILMPCTTDMYFTLAENEIECTWLVDAQLRPIDSPYGHIAGRPGHLPEVTRQVAQAVADLVGSTSSVSSSST